MGVGGSLAKVAHTALIGRDAELARVEEFLGAIDSGPVALLLEGEVGIGKTTLWKHGLASAAARGLRVLRCRPGERETQLAYAALGDLLADVPESALRDLPAPQWHALEVALLRAEPEGPQALPRAVGLGLLGLLRTLAEATPTLLAIDDAHWLDSPSENARIRNPAPAGTSASAPVRPPRRRTGRPARSRPHVPPLRARRARRPRHGRHRPPAARRPRPAALPAGGLSRVRRASGGNLYFALEIGRALAARGERFEPAHEVPIPASLQDLVRDRLQHLPAGARAAAQVAAALARPTVTAVDAAARRQAARRPPSTRACWSVTASASRLRTRCSRPSPTSCFRNPSAATCTGASPRSSTTRRSAPATSHSRPTARTKPSPRRSPRPPGGPRPAAPRRRGGAARAGPRLTPADCADARQRRGVEAAERLFEAGDVGPSRALLEEVVEEAPPGSLRAHAPARLGWVRTHEEGIRAGADAFFAALAEPIDDVRLRIEILQGLTWCLHSSRSVAAAMEQARVALELAEDLADPTVLRGRALARSLAFLESVGGEGWRPRRSAAHSRSSTRRRGRRCSAGPTGSTGSCSCGAVASRTRTSGSRRSSARRSRAATSIRCRSSSSRSLASSCSPATGSPRGSTRVSASTRASATGRWASAPTRSRSRRSSTPTSAWPTRRSRRSTRASRWRSTSASSRQASRCARRGGFSSSRAATRRRPSARWTRSPS